MGFKSIKSVSRIISRGNVSHSNWGNTATNISRAAKKASKKSK